MLARNSIGIYDFIAHKDEEKVNLKCRAPYKNLNYCLLFNNNF